MKSFGLFVALSAALLGGFQRLFHHEVHAAERATHGTCRVVSNSGHPEDVRPHLRAGETLRPVLRFGGDHQIACVDGAVPRAAARQRLKALSEEVWQSELDRECPGGYYGGECLARLPD